MRDDEGGDIDSWKQCVVVVELRGRERCRDQGEDYSLPRGRHLKQKKTDCVEVGGLS